MSYTNSSLLYYKEPNVKYVRMQWRYHTIAYEKNVRVAYENEKKNSYAQKALQNA